MYQNKLYTKTSKKYILMFFNKHKQEGIMKISNISNNVNFGKTALLTCTLKENDSKEKISATLYQMDPKNVEDMNDIKYSKLTKTLSDYIVAEHGKVQPAREFYLLQNDKTKEAISYAQTSHHFRPFNAKNEGLSTLIEEMRENTKYTNASEPLLAYIAKRAEERYDHTVYTAFGLDEIPSLKRAKFTETKLGEFFIPEKRYKVLIEQAEKRSQIEFLA